MPDFIVERSFYAALTQYPEFAFDMIDWDKKALLEKKKDFVKIT